MYNINFKICIIIEIEWKKRKKCRNISVIMTIL